MHDTLSQPAIRDVNRDSMVLLRSVSWEGYKTFLREVGDDAARLTYDDGFLEIEVSGKRHEQLKKLAGAIVETTLNAKGVPYAPLGSTTWSWSEKLKGLEADECYYIGPNAEIIAGLEHIDLAVDPAPNLAIEVDVAVRSIDKLPVYAAMGILEVWRIDEAANVFIHALKADGTYEHVDVSRQLPELTPKILSEHLQNLTAMAHSKALVKFMDILPQLLGAVS